MVLDKPVDSVNPDGPFPPNLAGGQLQPSAIGDGSFRPGFKPWQKLRPSIEILCNNQASGYAVAPALSLFLSLSLSLSSAKYFFSLSEMSG